MRAEALSGMTEAIYDAGLDPARWQGTLAALASTLGCNGAVITFLDAADCPLGYQGQGDPEAIASYVSRYRACDRVFAAVSAKSPGRVWSDEMVQPKAALHRSEFYADWARRTGMEHAMQAIALQDRGTRGFIGLARCPSRPAFDTEDVDTLQTLLPHVRRAMAMHLKLAGAAAAREGALTCLARLGYAVFTAGPGGVLAAVNATAELLLQSRAGVRLRAGTLDTPRPAQARALARLIGRAVDEPHEGGWLAIDRADDGPPLRCSVLPVGTGSSERLAVGDIAALLVIDSEPTKPGREGALTALFGLTAAEARVATLTVGGGGAPAIALAMGVLPATVRTHLKHAFEKTGAHGQTGLCAIVARLAGDGLARTQAD